MNTGPVVFTLIGFIFIAILIVNVNRNIEDKSRKAEELAKESSEQININLKKLKGDYELALSGTDKKQALEAGRKYYSLLREGQLTIYDEQAFANDLSAMR